MTRFLTTIRGQFALFAFALAMPLVALIGYGLYDWTRDEFAAAEAVVRRVAETSADRAAEHVASIRAALETIAREPQVRAMDAARCDSRLGDLAKLYPRVGSFTVVNRDSVIICSSRALPPGRVLRAADEDLQREMRAEPRFRVTKLVRSPLSGRWGLGLMHPVLGDDGALLGTVAAGIDPLQWNPFPPPEGLPAGAAVTVVAADGTVIARSTDAEKWVGHRAWDERIVQQVIARKEGVVRAKGADGLDRIFGVSAVADLPWFVLAGVPEESIFAPTRKRLRDSAAFLVLVVGVVLAVAWGFAARLAKPIAAIAEAVRARAEGRVDMKIPIGGPVEVVEVARELNRMIESDAQAQEALARQAERLRIVHEIDRAIIATEAPQAIAGAMIRPLRELLNVPRAIVNLFDLQAGEVEWLAAAGRQRTHVGPGVRYPMRLMGDLEGLKRGEPQIIDTRAQPPGPEVDALLASGVMLYMAVPMIAGGELIGAISFGGEKAEFPEEQVSIAREVATQLAIAISQARLFERVKRHAEELEQRVRERTSQLESANKELESFSYSVSHDLRAPLRAVDGYALMLQEDYAGLLDDEGKRLLGVVRGEAARMGQLIDDLLHFSQVGRKTIVRVPLDMRALAGEVVAELTQAYPQARIELGALPDASGDQALLRQVWTNLIGNALKYSAKVEAPRVVVGGRDEGTEHVYSVRDNGAGFDMRYYDKLFKVFQRLHRQEEFEGTGVGLAIVQRVIARHGGRAWAESGAAEGTCFRFAIPREA